MAEEPIEGLNIQNGKNIRRGNCIEERFYLLHSLASSQVFIFQ